MSSVSKYGRAVCVVALGFLAVAGLLLTLGRSHAGAVPLAGQAEPAPFTAEYYSSLSKRFGVGVVGVPIRDDGGTREAEITDYEVGLLHLGWYSDWEFKPDPIRPEGMQYAHLIMVKDRHYPTNTLEITASVAANPGSLWMVGNEPEGKIQQGNRTPAEYAEIYHHVHTLIKSLDPTAQVAIGGVILPTPLRLQWLDMVLDTYQDRYGQEMPVDVWNIHMQILQEKAGEWGAEIPAGLDATEGELFNFSIETGFYDNANPEIFKRLVTDMRQWMKDKGFQDKPLIISEYGVLLPSTYIGYGDGYGDEDFGNRVLIDFMYGTFNFLVNAKDPDLGYPQDDYRLVQQWLWYSLNTQPYNPDTGRGYNGSLFSHRDPTEMTLFGAAFRNYMHTLEGYPRILLPSMIRLSAPN